MIVAVKPGARRLNVAALARIGRVAERLDRLDGALQLRLGRPLGREQEDMRLQQMAEHERRVRREHVVDGGERIADIGIELAERLFEPVKRGAIAGAGGLAARVKKRHGVPLIA